jgi:hypothetical protein
LLDDRVPAAVAPYTRKFLLELVRAKGGQQNFGA